MHMKRIFQQSTGVAPPISAQASLFHALSCGPEPPMSRGFPSQMALENRPFTNTTMTIYGDFDICHGCVSFLDDIDELPIAMPISSGKIYALATLLEGN